MTNIEDRIKTIISEQLNLKLDKIQNHSSFVDDLGADSLDIIELIMALEEEFNIEITDEEAEKITTVQSAIDHVMNIKKDETKTSDKKTEDIKEKDKSDD